MNDSDDLLGTEVCKNQPGTSASRADTRKESEQKRRVTESQFFDEVVALLTMSGEKVFPKKMDKVTVLKETTHFIGLYDDLAGGRKGGATQSTCLQYGEVSHLLLNAMDAFMMIVSESGRIFYCTELVTSLLGHMQSRLVGQNLFDYILEREAPLLKEQFKPLGDSPCKDLPECPIICYPCREFQCNLKVYSGETGLYPQHHLFQCLSYLRVWKKRTSPDPPSPDDAEVCVSRDPNVQSCILLIAKLPTSPSVVDLPVSTNEVNFQFDMRVSREGKIIDVEKQATLVLGYLPGELTGVSFFDCIEPNLVTSVGESIAGILSKGCATTIPYRLVSKGGRYLWVVSKGTVSYVPWNGKPDHIVLSTRVLNYNQVLPENRITHCSRGMHPNEEGVHTTPLLREHPAAEMSCDSSSSLLCDSSLQPELPLSTIHDSIQHELHRKNQELFNLQCRFLEQQQLMEKERNQFYQITRQVMQCITCPQNVMSTITDVGHQQLSPPDIRVPAVHSFAKTLPDPSHHIVPRTALDPPRGYDQPPSYVRSPGSDRPPWF